MTASRDLMEAIRTVQGRASVPVPLSARFPTDSETVGDYNSRHWGKAWSIVAMTWEGCAYCLECAYYWPTFEDVYGRGEECPMPVFASDELFGDPCDNCHAVIG
jgi:hypothetical protein